MMEKFADESMRGIMSQSETDYVARLLGSGVELYGDNEEGEFELYAGNSPTLMTGN